MFRHRFLFTVTLIAIGLLFGAGLLASCGDQEPAPVVEPEPIEEPIVEPEPVEEPIVEPVEEPEPVAEPVEEIDEVVEPEPEAPPPAVAPTGRGQVNMDAVFPEGPGRELTLMGCTGCHNWVPLVILGFTQEEWERNARTHRDFVSAMSDEDFEVVYDYLKKNFTPDTPIPELPQELLDAWTSY
jgi:hypothetical protein